MSCHVITYFELHNHTIRCQTIMKTIKDAEKDVNAHFEKCVANIEEKKLINKLRPRKIVCV